MSILSKLFNSLKWLFAISPKPVVTDTTADQSPTNDTPNPAVVETPTVLVPDVVEETPLHHVDTLVDEVKVGAIKEGVLTKRIIIDSVIAVEAGFVDHPADRGGATNMGITKAVAEENRKMLVSDFHWDGDMKNITYDMAYAIYEKKYWTAMKLDTIAKHSIYVADKMFDLGVNCGVSRTSIWLQEFLNASNRAGKDYSDIKADGSIGNATLTALEKLIQVRGKTDTMKTLGLILICRQGTHYTTLATKSESQESFYWGWVNNRLQHHLEIYSTTFVKK